jgi:hypothetical protein
MTFDLAIGYCVAPVAGFRRTYVAGLAVLVARGVADESVTVVRGYVDTPALLVSLYIPIRKRRKIRGPCVPDLKRYRLRFETVPSQI